MPVGLIHKVEDAFTVSTLKDIVARKLLYLEAITLLYHVGNLGKLLRNFVRYHQFVLHIVVIYLKPFETFHQLGIVLIIIYGGHGTQLVEACCEHTLWIHIGKAQRTHNRAHSL